MKHVLATIERGAVGNHAVSLNEALTDAGHQVKLYAETIRPDYITTTSTLPELRKDLKQGETVLYQFANPSPIVDVLAESQCRLIINYHNITPARFFAKWSPDTASAINRARAQLARLAPITTAAIAVSDFNAEELVALGYRNVSIIPPLFSASYFDSAEKKSSGTDSWLFVGRIAPHKNIHTLIQAFDVYRRKYNDKAMLTIVGSTDTPLYGRAIEELITRCELDDVVTIVASSTKNDLPEFYAQASVFVSASEHEGFCIPLIEAAAMGIPVVAVQAAAIGDTLAGAGVLVHHADANEISDAVIRVHGDNDLREKLIAKGKARSQRFNPADVASQYVDALEMWQ